MKNILLAIRRILFAKQSGEAPSTDMVSSSLFYGYSSLTSIPLSLEGLRAVTDANEAFRGCTSITNIPDSWPVLGAVTKARACGGELV